MKLALPVRQMSFAFWHRASQGCVRRSTISRTPEKMTSLRRQFKSLNPWLPIGVVHLLLLISPHCRRLNTLNSFHAQSHCVRTQPSRHEENFSANVVRPFLVNTIGRTIFRSNEGAYPRAAAFPCHRQKLR